MVFEASLPIDDEGRPASGGATCERSDRVTGGAPRRAAAASAENAKAETEMELYRITIAERPPHYPF
jgi:hypothetical protein